MPTKPNFLMLVSDQHHPHVMGCEDDPVVRTPHLDDLAGRGVLFESCYCPSPLCVPSRMSFMTSRFPSDNGVWSNRCMLSSDIPTFAHALGAAEYETVLSGRMHFVGPDQRHGFETHLVGTMSATYIGGRNRSMPQELLAATGQNRYAVEVAGPGRTGYQFFDEIVAEACVEFLRARGPGRPFCLVAGFVLPHCPFVCPRDEFYHYLDRMMLPQVPEGYFEDLHPAVQLWRKNRGIEDLTENEIRRGPWKLVHYEGYRPQLFNLEDDPEEFRDLGEDPQYESIRSELSERVLADWSSSCMEEKLAQRSRAHTVLANWFQAVKPPSPAQWAAPPEATVFPDEGEC